MKATIKNGLLVVLAAVTVSVWFSQAGLAPAQSGPAPEARESMATPPSGSVLEEKAPKGPGKIAKTGEHVGEKIDHFTEQAASRVGVWINQKVVAGISWLKLIVSLMLFFAVAVIERSIRTIIDRRLKRMSPDGDLKTTKALMLHAVAKPLSLFVWVNGIGFALTPVLVHFGRPDGTNLIHSVVQNGAELGTAVAIMWFIFNLVGIIDARLKKWADATESSIDDILAPLIGKTLRVFIVVIGSILILQNLTGVEIGPLLASLGIGGLAVALAARDSIANFFGTITILFDKPFQVGHRVVIDGQDGVVESVGFRSTRIRMLTGHLLTIPNEKIVSTMVENIGMRPHIRWLTNITITYDTPPEKVERAVDMLKEILDHHEGLHPDFPPRVYFNGFNDWSLNLMVIVWYHPPAYWDMQAWLQRTCLEILRRFNEEGIDFAFPSQTVYLANDEKRQLGLKMLAGETVSYIPEGGCHE